MGATQSTSRSSNSRTIPIRPRTPLRFGSVPTPMPVNPYDYNTRPVRNLHPHLQTDSLTCILSQESYFNRSSSPAPSEADTVSDNSSRSPSVSTAPSSPYTYNDQPRFDCKYPHCAQTFNTQSSLSAHVAEGIHFASSHPSNYRPDHYGGGWQAQSSRKRCLPEPEPETEGCACNFCCTPLTNSQHFPIGQYPQSTMFQFQQPAATRTQMHNVQFPVDLQMPPNEVSVMGYGGSMCYVPGPQLQQYGPPQRKRTRAYY